MNDFQRIAFCKKDGTIAIPRDNLAISLHDNPSRTYLKLLQKTRDAQSLDTFLFFAVDPEFHKIKTVPTSVTTVTREYGFKYVPLIFIKRELTLTLPYAGATRIRFKGLPETVRLSVCC